jgi:hypothetical protein
MCGLRNAISDGAYPAPALASRTAATSSVVGRNHSPATARWTWRSTPPASTTKIERR